MKNVVAMAFITLLVVTTACAWVSPSSQTTSAGIQVHGDWTISITNPDGTVDAVHEFENSLDSVLGAPLLTALIAGQTSLIGSDPAYTSRYIIGMNTHLGANSTNRDWYCEEYLEVYSSSTNTVSEARVKASMLRVPSVGNPIELSGVCTVAGIPDTETAFIENVFTAFKPTSGVIYTYLNTSNVLADTMYNVPRLTRHEFNPFVEVQNRQVIGLNVVISFE